MTEKTEELKTRLTELEVSNEQLQGVLAMKTKAHGQLLNRLAEVEAERDENIRDMVEVCQDYEKVAEEAREERDRLRADLKAVRDERNYQAVHAEHRRLHIDRLRAEIQRKDEALRFYADKQNYRNPHTRYWHFDGEPVLVDGGRRAREAQKGQ
jgi:chromosome segregation ATPase